VTNSYTVSIQPGLNLIANQLDNGGDTLAEIMPSVPDGTVFSKYDNLNGVWAQAKFSSNAWAPSGIIELHPGQGAWLRSPSAFTLTFSGIPHSANVPPAIPSGQVWLLSRQTNDIGTYQNIIGAPPSAGAQVYQWDPTNQVFVTNTFCGSVWSAGTPRAAVGEAWWIAPQGGVPVPTPTPPVITQQPASVTVNPGNTATLSVTASGTEPLLYQWRLNGNAIPGATSNVLVLANVQPANVGNYDVVVHNDIGLVQSAKATVNIANEAALPFNDDFDAAGTLGSVMSGNGYSNNIGATFEAGEPLADGIPGGASVWITWQASVNGVATFSTAGSDFDTVLAVYTNANLTPVALTNLGFVAADDDSAAFLCSLLNFNALAGTTYYIQVDGYHGATGNIEFSWALAPTTNVPPVILVQPQGATVIAGSNYTLSVVVEAGPTVSYQWFSNNIALPDETNSTLVMEPAQAGIFTVGVTNIDTGAGLLSAAADVQLIVPGPGQRGNPTNVRAQDKFVAAAGLTPPDPNVPHDPASASGFTDQQTFSTVNATVDLGETNHCGFTACKTVWNSFSNSLGGTLTITTIGTTFNAVLEVYTGANLASLVPVACSANHGTAGETVTFPYVGGTLLWVVVGGVNCASGNVALNYNLVALPGFTAAPVTQTISNGGSVTLTAGIVGAPTLSYQWQYNGTNLPGETQAVLTFTNAQPFARKTSCIEYRG